MILRATRVLGAFTLLAVGAVHLQQYLGDGYRSIPTIGPLFMLNAIGSAVVAVGLLTPPAVAHLMQAVSRDREPRSPSALSSR